MNLVNKLNLESIKIKTIAIVLAIIPIVIFSIVYGLKYYHYTENFMLLLSCGLSYALWNLICETPIHELLHKYGAYKCNVECDINLKYKWRNKLWRIDDIASPAKKFPYCKPKSGTYITIKQLNIMSLFPIVICIFWLFSFVISKEVLLLMPAASSLGASMGDIMYVIYANIFVSKNTGKDIVFLDDGTVLECYVIS